MLRRCSNFGYRGRRRAYPFFSSRMGSQLTHLRSIFRHQSSVAATAVTDGLQRMPRLSRELSPSSSASSSRRSPSVSSRSSLRSMYAGRSLYPSPRARELTSPSHLLPPVCPIHLRHCPCSASRGRLVPERQPCGSALHMGRREPSSRLASHFIFPFLPTHRMTCRFALSLACKDAGL